MERGEMRATSRNTAAMTHHPDKAKELRELHESCAAALPPVGPIFKDPTEGDDGYADKPTRRKAK